MKVTRLRTNSLISPVVDKTPYFSWCIESEKENTFAEKYLITVFNGNNIVWDSGIVESEETSYIPYEGELESTTEYTYKVEAWDNHGEKGEEWATFETAFLSSNEFNADFIESTIKRKSQSEYRFGSTYPVVRFLKNFKLDNKSNKARLYITSYGVYRAYLNGKRIGDREFSPEFTTYDRILYYQTYDVTSLLNEGENKLEVFVGDGWYFSEQASPIMKTKSKEPVTLFLLDSYSEKGKERIVSDGSEKCSLTHIIYSDLYQGEKQDLRVDVDSLPLFPVEKRGYRKETLSSEPMDGIKAVMLLPATSIITTPKGESVVDFSQVIAGKARIKINIPKDKVVTFEYFETLDQDGNYINTMFAPQKNTVISNGESVIHEAWFTFHGFRYIRVTGMNVRKEDFTAVLLSSEKERLSSFSSSDERLNRLYKNVIFSEMSNMMSVPTDCPTREKAGYTGDILVYIKAALNNEEVTPFLSSWLSLVRSDQSKSGVIKIVSPYMKLYEGLMLETVKRFGDTEPTGVAGWSDAIVFVPYEIYKKTGNKLILKENYSSSKAWCDYVIRTAKEKRGEWGIDEKYDRYLWNTGFHFGEWLVPSIDPAPVDGDQYASCKKTSYYTAPFFGYESVKRMSEIALALDNKEDYEYYRSMSEKMKEAIEKGIMDSSLMPENLMGAYILAFAFDLVPNKYKEEYKNKIISLIKDNNYSLDTGFLATPFIIDVLMDLGLSEIAYKVLFQTKRPSWLYEVEHGATTIWEAWDADDALSKPRFVSFNHYAFGSVDDALTRRVVGLDVSSPRHFIINPELKGCPLTWIKRSYLSPWGEVKVEWHNGEDNKSILVTIPSNTTAILIWNGMTTQLGSGTYYYS